jgi:hypothetical protein
MGYTYGSNTPGYLPESDDFPFIVETLDEAKRGLIDDMKRDEEFYGDYGDNESGAENLAAAAEEVNLWSGPDSITVDTEPDSPHHLGRAYWIAEVDDEEIARELDDQCQSRGCKPCPHCSRWDCGACRAGEVPDSGSSHRIGCPRDWIG